MAGRWSKDGDVATEKLPGIVLVDDLRSFVDGRVAQVARTSRDGIEALERHRGQRLDELWLDHDLGEDDTIWPVVEVLERAASEEGPFDIGVVYVHSANPAGAEKIMQALRRWGYNVRSAAGSPHVGYLAEAE
ncbi:cyclic-phosphate processing receiver domain-containing protein [Micromonospora coerulea]|uniref:cyclic-phosphate processing receiver domain-containing protein n=1 Tax=Micromonospora coerulea TaxID=47856 RepID=UPI001908AC0F|nr:cyclic-phosphate processing receiver domain-containing protein [Micromonospora veneta]